MNDNGGTANDGRITVVQPSTYWGRQSRAEAYFNVTGPAGTRTIEVSQEGHDEFVDFETNLNNFELNNIPYNETSAAFDIISNSKYLSFVMNNPDPVKPHYSIAILIVDEDLDGIYTDTYVLDSNDSIEIIDDPGLNHFYRVRLRVDFEANLTSDDIRGDLTITGWSGVGNNHDTLVVSMTHKGQPSAETS